MIENFNSPNNPLSVSQAFKKMFLKKGVFEILNEIKFVPKNYNSIKAALCSSPKGLTNRIISSRTLDSRINDLKRYNLIELYDSKLEQNVRFYRLSGSGIGILSLIYSIIDQGIEFSTTEICSAAMKTEQKIREFNWAFREEEILTILNSTEYISTLSSTPKKNYLRGYNSGGIKLLTDKGTSEIPWSKIKFAWNNLVNDGFLERNNYAKATYRSSFIVGFFNCMKGVEVIKDQPITLGIKPLSA